MNATLLAGEDREDSAGGAASAVDAEAAALEREHCRAFVNRDIARLDRLWADDLLVNSPINRVHDKQTVLGLLDRGVIAHYALDPDIEVVRRSGDLLIVMGADAVRDTPRSPIVRRRFTHVWRLEDGTWRLFVRQAHVIAGAA